MKIKLYLKKWSSTALKAFNNYTVIMTANKYGAAVAIV